ncbi:MAG: uroporphyrinogen decarboxylase family protein [Candidatus Firestonebacteria bacterium]
MNSKERVLTAFASRTPDRVPINYGSNGGLETRLIKHFKVKDRDDLLKVLGVDFREAWPEYIGPKLHKDLPEKGMKADNWGIRRRWVEHGSGGYWDFCDFPLKNATEEEVAAWPLPDPDKYNYSLVSEACRRQKEYAVYTGNCTGDIINGNGMLRGMEQTLIDLLTEEPAGMLLAKRRTEINSEIIGRTLEAAKGGIDFIWLGEDLGTQLAPMVSLELYRKAIRPLHQKIIDVAKSFKVLVMMHTCGSSSWAYEDFIEMGINIVDTLQPEAVNMSPAYLKKTFGGRLAFHGCISTAGPVAFGRPPEVVKYCKDILDIMMPGGGYAFAPTHSLQDNSPTENVLAMYETANTYGRYK